MTPKQRNRNNERGQTILLVVVCIAVLVGMAALAIDIATLYTASSETRRTAQAAALAGAHAIGSSGITSNRHCGHRIRPLCRSSQERSRN
jgi:uncharacterized membrane protein